MGSYHHNSRRFGGDPCNIDGRIEGRGAAGLYRPFRLNGTDLSRRIDDLCEGDRSVRS